MSDNDGNEKIFINGVNGATGNLLVPPLDIHLVAELAKTQSEDQELVRFLEAMHRMISRPSLGLPFDINPADVVQAGWGVVFHADEDEAVKTALQPLIEHRRQQIGDATRVKVLTYRPNERRARFLARHGVSAGTVEPTKVPFYLLLVGSPDRIPWLIGHELSVEYAIGRLHFDTVAEYDRYVASVIEYETSQTVPNAKEAVFFAPRHAFDQATQLSADHLVNPLTGETGVNGQPAKQSIAERFNFRTRRIWGEAATKQALLDTLPADNNRVPAFLFSASHGVGFPQGDQRQLTQQGALVCQDWPGLGEISAAHYVAGSDIADDQRVHGMITFHFACYGAGTPASDRFFHRQGEQPPSIAPQAFVAALPKRLLTHPGGGALACIGHVERAWGYSISTHRAGVQLLPFENAIGRILTGKPVGYAMVDFYQRYAALSTSLSSKLEDVSFGTEISDLELATDWIERNDAEGYVVLGDPAVCMRVADLT